MIPRLVDAEKFVVELTAFNAGDSIVEFVVRGRASALSWATSKCTSSGQRA